MNKRGLLNVVIFVVALSAGFLIAKIGWNTSIDTPDAVIVPVAKVLPITEDLELETIGEISFWQDEDRLAPSMRLLDIGEGYHGDEVPAENGDEWLGLFRGNNGYQIKPTTLQIKRVHDPIVDGEEDIRTGKSVSVLGSNRPLFLVKGGKSVRPGKAVTFYRGLTDDVENELRSRDIIAYNGFTLLDKEYRDSFTTANKQEYELKVIKARNPDGQRILALSLESMGVRQILYTVRTWDEYPSSRAPEWSGQVGRLFWVGDIDRDGKPDFYMELTGHENSVWKALFLSSEAAKGEHVKLSAEFVITGC